MSSQNLVVFEDETLYKVMTGFTHEVVFKCEKADEAIQYAVDSLSETGGQIVLGTGVYLLEDQIRLASNVKLCGGGRGTKLSVTAASESGVGISCEKLHGVVISDLTVTAGGNKEAKVGIVIDDCGDCKVRDVFCVGFKEYGIWVRNSSFLCEIRGCSLAGNEKAGIFLDRLTYGRCGDFVPNLVTNCIIYGGGKGIECNNTVVLNIVACAVYQSRDVAYHLHDRSNSVLISGCRSFQIGSHAVLAEKTHEFNLSSNIFCWHTGHGVVIKDCYWGTITGNEVIDTGSINPGGKTRSTKFNELPKPIPLYNGINLLKARGYNITGNTVFNWSVAPPMEYGIYEDAESYNNTITSNNVNYYEKEAVYSEGRESIVANNVGYKDAPYNREEGVPLDGPVQSFQPELTRRFIRQQS